MNSRFMVSVAAAALIAGSGFAFAQGAGGAGSERGAGGGGSPPTAQQNPAPSGGAMNRDSGAAQSKDSMSKDGAKNAQSKDSMSKDTPKDSAQSKEGRSGNTADTKSGATTDTKSGSTADTKSGATTDTKSGATADTKSGASSSQTTGNAATSATAAPPAEKRTQIVSAIRSETSIKETTNVNFNISVGARVPTSVHFYPLPPRIVEIYPEWRGYQVILVGGRYVIVRPQTHEIVYILEG